MNIALTPEQSEFVRRLVGREFGNTSEFFRHLIRGRMQREIAADLKFLESTKRGAPAGPSEHEIAEIIRTQRKVRKDLKGEGSL